MADLLKALQSQIEDRLSSPLTSSFLVSWALWNYKFLMILFSMNSVSQTIKQIDAIAFPATADIFLRGAVYPLLSSLIYIFVYPYPSKLVYVFAKKRQQEIRDMGKEIEDQALLTSDESQYLRTDMAKLKHTYALALIEKDKQIRHLEDTVKALNLRLAGSEKGEG